MSELNGFQKLQKLLEVQSICKDIFYKVFNNNKTPLLYDHLVDMVQTGSDKNANQYSQAVLAGIECWFSEVEDFTSPEFKAQITELGLEQDHPIFRRMEWDVLSKTSIEPTYYEEPQKLYGRFARGFITECLGFLPDQQLELLLNNCHDTLQYSAKSGGFSPYFDIPLSLLLLGSFYRENPSPVTFFEHVRPFEGELKWINPVLAEFFIQNQLENLMPGISMADVTAKFPLRMVGQDRIFTVLNTLLSSVYTYKYEGPEEEESCGGPGGLFQTAPADPNEPPPLSQEELDAIVIANILENWNDMVGPLAEKDLANRTFFSLLAKIPGIEEWFDLLTMTGTPFYTTLTDTEMGKIIADACAFDALQQKEKIHWMDRSISQNTVKLEEIDAKYAKALMAGDAKEIEALEQQKDAYASHIAKIEAKRERALKRPPLNTLTVLESAVKMPKAEPGVRWKSDQVGLEISSVPAPPDDLEVDML